MSNRNFDSRVIIQRLKDQNQAQSVYNNEVNGIAVIRNPQNSNPSPQVIQNYKAGAQNAYSKGLLGGLVTENLGGTANFFAGSIEVPYPPQNLVPTVTTTPTGQVSIAFTPGSAGTYPITNYAYSIDGGATYVRVSPPQTTSPVVITGLTVGATYTILLRAISSAGLGANSAPLTVVIANVPMPPILLSRTVVPGDRQIQLSFTQGDNGGSPITNYFYSVDNGVSFGLFSPAQTTSPVTITGLTNNTAYQVVLKAVNVVGSSVASNMVAALTYTPPSTPTSLSATSGVGSVQIAFTQTTGAFSGPITNYQYSTDNGATFTAFSPAQTTSPVTISGLATGTTYQVALKAVNVAGVSPASSVVSATTAGSPSAPTALSATSGNQQVTIAFTPGADGGSPITNYQYSTDNGATFTAFSPAQTTSPVTITGLAIGTTYQVVLRSVTAVSVSPSSSAVSASTFAYPAAPTSLSSTAGNTQVQIAFTAGANGGSAITNYQYSIDNGVTYYPFSPAQTTSPVLISGLSNSRIYQVGLKAVNVVGAGTASSIISASTIYGPQPPTSLVATPGNGQISIAFTPGSDGGSPITNYQYTTDNGATFTAFSPAVTSSPVVITGLTNGTTYNIKLMAINIVATSIASSTVTATPASSGTIPGTPTISLLVGGDQAIYILYYPVSDGGSPLTNFQYSINGGTSFTAFSPAQTTLPLALISPSTLVNGTTYTVAIKAVNANGASLASNTMTVTCNPNTVTASSLLIQEDANNASSYPGSGTTWTNLISGQSQYNATLTAGVTYSATLPNNPSISTGNLTFDGVTQIANIPNGSSIQPVVNTPITLQIWAYVTTPFVNGDGLISKQYSSPSFDGYSLTMNTDGSVRLNMNGASVNATYASSASAFTPNAWNFFTIIPYFGGPSRGFINGGIQVINGMNAETGIPSPTAPLQLMQGIQGYGNYTPGSVSAFYYYNRALDQTEIIQNFDATRKKFGL